MKPIINRETLLETRSQHYKGTDAIKEKLKALNGTEMSAEAKALIYTLEAIQNKLSLISVELAYHNDKKSKNHYGKM